MRVRRTQMISMAVAAGLAASAAAPAGASAVQLSCTFAANAEVTPGIMLLGGSGTYTLSTPPGSAETQCTTNGGPIAQSRIASSGFFTHTACASGTWSSSTTSVDVGSVRHQITYRIDVAGLHGVLDILTVDGIPDPLPVNGTVVFEPVGGTCTTGASGLAVRGHFHTR